MDEVREAVAQGIRSHRASRRWTQQHLADLMGWSPATVSASELGNKGFTFTEVVRLAEVFDVTVVQLLRDAPESLIRRVGG